MERPAYSGGKKLDKLAYKLRIEEVHKSGVDLIVEREEIAFNELVGLQGQDRTYAAYTTPAQWGPTEESPKPVMVSRLTHYLEHEDGRAKVLALCRQYLGYLEKMVGDFLKAHS